MSYCRFGWPIDPKFWDGTAEGLMAARDVLMDPRSKEIKSDLYVYMDYRGDLCCCGCRLDRPESFFASSTQEMVDHLRQHERAGHHFPASVIPDLWDDDEENFPKEKPDEHH